LPRWPPAVAIGRWDNNYNSRWDNNNWWDNNDWWEDHDNDRNDDDFDNAAPVITQEFDQESESGDVDQSFDVSGTGDNSN
jgi:hypothetical protein